MSSQRLKVILVTPNSATVRFVTNGLKDPDATSEIIHVQWFPAAIERIARLPFDVAILSRLSCHYGTKDVPSLHFRPRPQKRADSVLNRFEVAVGHPGIVHREAYCPKEPGPSLPLGYCSTRSKEFANRLDEFCKVAEVFCDDGVDESPIDFQVFVNQDVAQTDHQPDSPGKWDGQQLLRREDFRHLTIFCGRFQPEIGHDVVTNIENGLDCDLKIAFSTAGKNWIFEKGFFGRDLSDPLQITNTFTDSLNPCGNYIGVNQRPCPRGFSSSNSAGRASAKVPYQYKD